METSQIRNRVEFDRLLPGLVALLGPERVAGEPPAPGRFLRPGSHAPGLIAVRPADPDQVQGILRFAREHRVAVVTCNDSCLSPEDRDREGILLDFSGMNRVERVDVRNLVAHIERGVTWEQLNGELRPLGVKTGAPVAANSRSVVECVVARAVCKAAAKFPDYPLMNMKVVLGDGTLVKTGTHGLNEEAADGRSEGGPNLSQWYVGADDILGVVTRATIMLWPVCEKRSARVYAFQDPVEIHRALRNVPRTELGVEVLALNRAALENLCGPEAFPVSPWTLIVGFEGRARLVEHHQRCVDRLLEQVRCRRAEELEEVLTGRLDEPWMEASRNHTAFFTLFPRLAELDGEVDRAAARAGVGDSRVGKILVSLDRGRAVHAVCDWHVEEDLSEAVTQLNLDLADRGAFFDRPQGPLGRKVYLSIPNHLALLKRIKGFLDPDHILNPGRTVTAEDPDWHPLRVRDGETGLTVSNLKEVKDKLALCLGAEWVSDNPADLIGYSRDFTVFSGERPNLVVLPDSTEQVQAVVRIAYEHGIPVVPQTTGFNHGGLTVPRKGGILVDLKRMDQLCAIDEESMTVTVSPGMRMRFVWWEAVKRQATPGIHLKPILPLTLGSVSLLSNYVARGAPGTTCKYGTAPELTVKMTWVLPNGELFQVGPGAVPGVGTLPLHYGPGPEINGMFFNADGQFGICTELAAKLYPEYDGVEEREELITASCAEMDGHRAFCKIIDAIYEVSRENITDFIYKGHPGTFALGLSSKVEGTNVKDLITMSPRHPLGIMVSGYDAEELAIKKEILNQIMDKHDLFLIDVNMFGPDLAEMLSTEPLKKSLGVKDNFAGSYKGAFQWTAAQVKMDLLPEIAREYERLVTKYWKTTDPTVSIEHAMTDTAIQGPLPYGRCGPCEFDYWWDQGNPEDVKRASQMIHKTNRLLLRFGGGLWRNMFGAGEYALPLWGAYFEILKRTKRAFDPQNLMHPDVLPLTEDYL